MSKAEPVVVEEIAIGLIDPNPYRDFTLYPYDPVQVARLKDSYKENGDFGVIPVRPHPTKKGRYEQASSHHRLKVMVDLKYKKARCVVADHDDAAMLSIMVAENAGQQDVNFASTLDAVAAVTRQITHALLVEDISRIREKWPEMYESEKAVESALGRLHQGVGAPVLRAYFKHYAGDQLTKTVIEGALGTLKGSVQYPKLMQSIIARVVKEYDADSEQVARVGQLSDAIAGKKVNKEANTGQTVTTSRDKPTVSTSSKTGDTKKPPKPAPEPRGPFDAVAANVFSSIKQVDTFRRIVTAPAMAAVLPVEKQVEVAKAIVAYCKDEDRELTARAITDFTGEKLAEFYVGQSKADRAAAKCETVATRLQSARDDLLHGLAHVVSGAQRYEKELKTLKPEEIPAGDVEFIQKLQSYKQQIDKFFDALLPTKKAITS